MVGMSRRRLWRTLVLSLLLALHVMGGAGATTAPQTGTASEGPTWVAAEQVSEAPDAVSEAPALAVTQGGVAHLVWEQDDTLYHAYRTGDGWITPTPIPGVGGGEQPALAAGPGGDVHLVYAKLGDPYMVYNVYRASWNGSELQWGLPRNVSQHQTLSSHSPDVAVDADGGIHIVAQASTEELYYASIGDGSYGPIPNAAGHGPSIAVSNAPAVTVQIVYRHSAVSDIFLVRGTDGSWDLPEAVSDTERFSTAPRLALDDEVVHVVWQETIGSVPQVQYTRGLPWTPVITLSASTAGATLPALARDVFGTVHVAWGDGAFPSYSVLHTYSRDGPSWHGSEPIQGGSLRLDQVALFGADDGSVHAAWVEGPVEEVWYGALPSCRIFLPLVLRS